ncbi:MAG: hypothetical protein U1F43_19815 [Myxococcota bacterium]
MASFEAAGGAGGVRVVDDVDAEAVRAGDVDLAVRAEAGVAEVVAVGGGVGPDAELGVALGGEIVLIEVAEVVVAGEDREVELGAVGREDAAVVLAVVDAGRARAVEDDAVRQRAGGVVEVPHGDVAAAVARHHQAIVLV